MACLSKPGMQSSLQSIFLGLLSSLTPSNQFVILSPASLLPAPGLIAVGLSDPSSGQGAGQVLCEPPWDTKQALSPADARLRGREELAFADAFYSTQTGAHLL